MDDIERLQKASKKRSAESKKSRSAHKRNKTRPAHNDEEDKKLKVHYVSELLTLTGGMVEKMLATLRGPTKTKRSKENRPTRTWFNQANNYFNGLMTSFTAFIQSKNENLCCGNMDTSDVDGASTCATSNMDSPSDGDYDASASVETWSENESKIILPSDKSSDRDYRTSAEEVLKVISTSKTYSCSKSQRANKNYSKTPKWSSERCEC
eukprot:scaffold6624_cov160-Skeletonema_menzelii.AAC.3